MPGAVCLLLYAYRFGVRPVVLLPHHHDQLVGHAGVAHACGKHAAKRQLGRVVAQVDDAAMPACDSVKRVVVLHLAGTPAQSAWLRKRQSCAVGPAEPVHVTTRETARVEKSPHTRGARPNTAGAARRQLAERQRVVVGTHRAQLPVAFFGATPPAARAPRRLQRQASACRAACAGRARTHVERRVEVRSAPRRARWRGTRRRRGFAPPMPRA